MPGGEAGHQLHQKIGDSKWFGGFCDVQVFASEIVFLCMSFIYEIQQFQCRHVRNIHFGMSNRNLVTRAYVFDVVFRHVRSSIPLVESKVRDLKFMFLVGVCFMCSNLVLVWISVLGCSFVCPFSGARFLGGRVWVCCFLLLAWAACIRRDFARVA